MAQAGASVIDSLGSAERASDLDRAVLITTESLEPCDFKDMRSQPGLSVRMEPKRLSGTLANRKTYSHVPTSREGHITDSASDEQGVFRDWNHPFWFRRIAIDLGSPDHQGE
jgi:hypothetical protein